MLSGRRDNSNSAAEQDKLVSELSDARMHIDSLQNELVTYKRAAEAAAKELEALTYGISHDLRAPLRAIEGFARILEEDFAPTLGDEGQGHILIIREATQKLDRHIEGMLALSRVGQHGVVLNDVDMTALARRTAEEVCCARKINPDALTFGELPDTRGDKTLLQQVWGQLLDNAVKFSMGARAPRIEISGEAMEDSCLYRIQDNGAGFDMRYASRLFSVFQRLHAEKEFPGAGVGLAIVHRIVKRHGGRVWAEGERDKGACFTFELPRDGGQRSV